jgi:DNA (cytosine-5)-methyltransferase 1
MPDTSPGIIDLFSGVGGLSLGAARAGFSVKAAVEIDAHAISAHRRNFSQTAHIDENVRALTGADLRKRLGLKNGDLAGIVGGPPCQGFSSIGKNEVSDPRNTLFADFFRIVSEARPKFFLAENVPGILLKKYETVRETARSYVQKEYTLLPPITICARDFGVPTTRTRVFFYGYLNDQVESLTVESFKPPAHVQFVTVKEALKGLPVKINPNWQTEQLGWRIARKYGEGYFQTRLHGKVPENVGDDAAVQRLKKESKASGSLGTIHSEDILERYMAVECGGRDPVSKSHKLDPNGFCPTIRAGTDVSRGSYQAVRPLHPTEGRVITPREAARLQGFPDWFQFAPTKWHSFRQIGNSVSPLLAERILSIIHKALGNVSTAEE